jgi:hypothetical protein
MIAAINEASSSRRVVTATEASSGRHARVSRIKAFVAFVYIDNGWVYFDLDACGRAVYLKCEVDDPLLAKFIGSDGDLSGVLALGGKNIVIRVVGARPREYLELELFKSFDVVAEAVA